ncbi:MAG: nucleotide exchange factor GrpE [Verrucomicrobiota bacterium]
MTEGDPETQNLEPEEEGVAPESESPEETPAAAETEASEEAVVAEPEEELDPMAKLEQEAEKWRDLATRSQAELENFRKRMAREKADAIKFGNSALIESLLPVIDNFNFGLQAARQEDESGVVYQGMSMVYKQIEDFLSDQGVEEVPAEGKPFDPNLHEAVQQQASDEVENGVILSVIRRGYKLHDRLLRAANVVVSTGPAAAEEEGEAEEPANAEA